MAPVTELLWPAFRDGDLSLNHADVRAHTAQPEPAARPSSCSTRRGTSARSRACRAWRACCRWRWSLGALAAAAPAGGCGRRMTPLTGPRQFGNIEANLRFIDATGRPAATVRRVARNRHAAPARCCTTLLERGCRAQGVELRRRADRRGAPLVWSRCRSSGSPASRCPSPTRRSTSS